MLKPIEHRNDTTGQLRIRVGKLLFETFKEHGCIDSTCLVCKWRWHVKALNHKLLATSGEPFDDRDNAERAMKTFIIRLST